MTALVAPFGFVPMAIATRSGASEPVPSMGLSQPVPWICLGSTSWTSNGYQRMLWSQITRLFVTAFPLVTACARLPEKFSRRVRKSKRAYKKIDALQYILSYYKTREPIDTIAKSIRRPL